MDLLYVLCQQAMVTEYRHEGGDLLITFPAQMHTVLSVHVH